MNLQHLRCMAEVERAGSVTKAAANLFMGQPNLSKAIKEVENEIGITVFNRSAKGVFPTPKGAEFLRYVNAILEQLDKIEAMYKPAAADIPSLCICSPFGEQITVPFYSFISRENISGSLILCSDMSAAERVCEGECGLAVIRFPASNEDYYRAFLSDKNLTGSVFFEFCHSIIISENDPLANKSELTPQMLENYVHVVRKDSHEEDMFRSCRRKIVLDGVDEFEAIAVTGKAFAAVPPMKKLPCGFVSKRFAGAEIYKDMLIFRSKSRLNEYETRFAEFLSDKDKAKGIEI